MNVPNMVVQSSRLSETFAADMTSIRFLSSVGSAMLYKVLVQSEPFVANLTFVRFEIDVTAVVSLQ